MRIIILNNLFFLGSKPEIDLVCQECSIFATQSEDMRA